MDQWLDSLSEDWVSQPRSPHSSSILQESLLKNAPSPSENGSQSRIPRYKARAVSGSSTTSNQVSRKPSSFRKSSQVEAALKEKTSSRLNVSQKRDGQTKPRNPSAKLANHQGSKTSTESACQSGQGTVQYTSSPAKGTQMHGTPEWKKRVLKENAGGDLFSPPATGLESVFKPPTITRKARMEVSGEKRSSSRQGIATRVRLSSPIIEGEGRISTKPMSNPEEKVHSLRGLKPMCNTPSSSDRQEVASPPAPDDRKSGASSNEQESDHAILCQSDTTKSTSGSACHKDGKIEPGVDCTGAFSDRSFNENISPFYVSKHGTADGRIEYAAIDMSMQRLRSHMDKMRLQQQNIPTSRSSDNGVDYVDSNKSENLMLREQLEEVTSQSLPDDLSMGTDAYAANGGFVTLRRGGYSNNGSFHRRSVSPSLLPEVDGTNMRLQSSAKTDQNHSLALPRNFSQTKSRTPSSPPPSLDPRTPQSHSHRRSDSDDRPRSSGSPLKLFDKYDTFTNERLIRRLSKFEETIHQNPKGEGDALSSNGLPSSPSPRRRRPYKQNWTDPLDEIPVGRRLSSFGEGELDNHPFQSYKLPVSSLQTPSQSNSSFKHGGSLHEHDLPSDNNKGDGEARLLTAHQQSPENCPSHDDKNLYSNSRTSFASSESRDFQEAIRNATGKRLPYSPAKNPATKRRRTLLASEDHDICSSYPQEFDVPLQAVSGRKRKDARYDSGKQVADPSILAARRIRQPKVPSMNQSGMPSWSNKSPSVPAHPDTSDSQDSPLNEENAPKVDPPTQIVAGALATMALNTAHEVTYGSRKASVTTADFFNEAQQIMQLIRAKGRPRSSHATTEGSEAGKLTIVEESFVEDFTKDRFTRPPSREGSPHALSIPERLDARAVSHLRKFEDNQDFGLALSSSLKALEIGQPRTESMASAVEDELAKIAEDGTESDPPNTRIRESIVPDLKPERSSSTQDFSILDVERHQRSQQTKPNSGPSSGRSVPTNSSHSSSNRMIIAPETVAHLLSDQMAGMIFDRQKQLWVKRKSSRNIGAPIENDQAASEGTNEDLFADIPDLSVNEMEELKLVKDAVSSVKSTDSAANRISIHDQAPFAKTCNQFSNPPEREDDIRPRTAEGKSIPPVENSSAPSKFSHLASSGILPGTRATSWGDEALAPKEPQLPLADPQLRPADIEIEDEGQVEHEISIFEGREDRTPKQQRCRKHQARVVTVAFSSPLVEHRAPDLDENDGISSNGEESELNLDDSPTRLDSDQDVLLKKSVVLGCARKMGQYNSSRRRSLNSQSYLARPMSRLDEEDEMSVVRCSAGDRHMSMEVAVTTPLPINRSLILPPSTNRRSSIGFQLSPLPEFTVHQIDKPVDRDPRGSISRLPDRRNENRLSLTAQNLVKRLTDLEPYEPFWDYLRIADLRERELGTLHMLDEFCARLEELDVSNNQIRELSGIPNTIRQLKIRGNCLSDLAAWDLLHNLQYLDVSNNQISNLQGFKNLFHLRSLKADGNEISSINGLEDLNGLTSLSLRGNQLRALDFMNFDLQRLSKLDVHNNKLVNVLNLHQLPVLETCILSNNDLEDLDFAISVPLSRLQILDISDNRLSFIDLAEVPKLKSLKLDRNCIASIESISSLKHLETLSWREQTLVPAYGFSEVQYQHCQEIRNLHLSGNAISTFAPSTPFLNLQHLELASTGLQNLSPDFGLKCPNLRTLNLNYNALRDLRPIMGVVRLQHLFVAGNRVSRLRRTTAVLDRIGKELTEIDLRNNTLTVGFYTPQNSSRDEKQMVPHAPQIVSQNEELESREAKAYLLPALQDDLDEKAKERLDEGTKLRRRVYEMLIVNSCKRVERLDGLAVDRKTVGTKDGVWERLIELGVLKERDAKGDGCQ